MNITRNRSVSFLLAAGLAAALCACSGGGTPSVPQSIAKAPQEPAAGATAESLVNATYSPATVKTLRFSNFKYHVMPVYGAASQSKPAARTPATTTYPMDLAYYGGPLSGTATVHNVYVDCPAGPHCWGTPADVITSLAHSRMLQVARQYTGQVSLSLGKGVNLSVPFFTNTVYQNDILAYLHAAVGKIGANGVNHIYNLFLPQGIDTCFDQSDQCYSPDNPANFAFCGYHAAVQYYDYGVVLFTVEPYQGAPGCNYLNENDLNSATANVLSHETFETITDPIPGTGWVNPNGFGEIGDECAWSSLTPETFASTGSTYNIQLEYSNQVHGCSDQPSLAPPV